MTVTQPQTPGCYHSAKNLATAVGSPSSADALLCVGEPLVPQLLREDLVPTVKHVGRRCSGHSREPFFKRGLCISGDFLAGLPTQYPLLFDQETQSHLSCGERCIIQPQTIQTLI